MDNFSSLIYGAVAENAAQLGYDPESTELPLLCDRLGEYLRELLDVNTRINLTAIKDPAEAALKHIADSLTVIRFVPENAKVIDVGTGGGLPAMPLALARKDVRVCALDGTGKKIAFIRDTIEKMGIPNAGAINGRAEELTHTKEFREAFDCATARALARLNVLLELCLPFVKVGGVFISMKGPQAADEIAEAKRALKTLGGEIVENKTFNLTFNGATVERSLIIIKKIAKTPENYPRNNSSINKNPL